MFYLLFDLEDLESELLDEESELLVEDDRELLDDLESESEFELDELLVLLSSLLLELVDLLRDRRFSNSLLWVELSFSGLVLSEKRLTLGRALPPVSDRFGCLISGDFNFEFLSFEITSPSSFSELRDRLYRRR
jgi:hypothetical protein